MDDKEEKYTWTPSEMDLKMSDAVGHTVKLKLRDGHEVTGWAGYYEDATSADYDYPIIYIMNEDGDGGNGYAGDQILELEIVDN